MDAAPPANTSNCNQSIPSCFKDQSSWAIVRTVKDWNAFIKWMSYRIKYRWIVSKPLVTQQRFGCCCRTVSGHSFIRLFFSSPCFVLLKYNDGPLMTSWQNYLCQELPTAGCLQIPPDANHFKMKHCHISHRYLVCQPLTNKRSSSKVQTCWNFGSMKTRSWWEEIT